MRYKILPRLPARGPILAVLAALIIIGAAYLQMKRPGVSLKDASSASKIGCREARHAFSTHASDVWLTLSGPVIRLLGDEYGRYQHQRFIVGCSTGLTVLIINDISIGKRVPVSLGDLVTVRGQYVWNALGGLVHFTHHDPSGGVGGWILFQGALYSFGSSAVPAGREDSPYSGSLALRESVQGSGQRGGKDGEDVGAPWTRGDVDSKRRATLDRMISVSV